MRQISLWLATFFALTLAACAPQAERIASAAAPREEPVWAFEASDLAVDPAFKFGRLANGMRYVIRPNATPRGTALVRMDIATGSLDEADNERGFAHFVEHMAFNGSTNVPEGEMVRLLEREGLAFGADTNASTGFEATTYALDLPRSSLALMNTALMLMRETASELKFAPEAVERERGVIFSEMRDRNSWQLRNTMEQMRFLHPRARFPERFAIGTTETLTAASAKTLKAFWRREYVPSQTTVIVIGDFDPALVEAAIVSRFGSWVPAPAEPQPSAGPVEVKPDERTGISIDPALSERVTASRHGPWLDEPDTVAQRRENVLRQIGYSIVNRRLQSVARRADPPFRGAGFGTSEVFRAGRTTNLLVDTVDGTWPRGLAAAAIEYRRALKFGFTRAEVDEQIANLRTAAQDGAASAGTRSHGALANAVFALLRDDLTPATPESSLARLESYIAEINPKRVLAALKREAVSLKQPLLRFQGRKPPAGGEQAIRAAWASTMRRDLGRSAASSNASFAYSQFGPPGEVASDSREAALGIRQLRFANGVRLNIKRTDLEKDRVHVRLALDGGEMLNTRENPLATEMVSVLPAGGLGKHSADELESILAGRTVGTGFSAGDEEFSAAAQTTPRDLELQLQLFAAMLTDPGYRPEGEQQYRLSINNFFAQMRATPTAALSNALGGILSDNDPRFTLQIPEAYRKLTFAKLRQDLADRFARGAIEIGIVGDIGEEEAIALVARTLGALPAREPEFRPYAEQRQRPFTADRTPRVIRHTGPADQALLRYSWLTRDDSDPTEALGLELLERIVRIGLTETLREKLGKAYSPSASSAPSSVWRGYGVFGIAASVAVHEVPATRAAIAEALAELRKIPPDADTFQRARQPMLEGYDNALKSNRSWMALTASAQSRPERIERYLLGKQRLLALTPATVMALAQRYLTVTNAVEVLVLPESVQEPK